MDSDALHTHVTSVIRARATRPLEHAAHAAWDRGAHLPAHHHISSLTLGSRPASSPHTQHPGCPATRGIHPSNPRTRTHHLHVDAQYTHTSPPGASTPRAHTSQQRRHLSSVVPIPRRTRAAYIHASSSGPSSPAPASEPQHATSRQPPRPALERGRPARALHALSQESLPVITPSTAR